jgi:hypothetical protein
MPKNPELITTAQAAAILRCSGKSILRRVDTGQLTPELRMPGRTGAYLFDAEVIRRIRRADIEAFLGDDAVTAQPA